VIVVGPLNDSATTRREIDNAELSALEFEAHGVAVSRFYAPNNNWEQIKSAANGAHFFIYRGHGIYWNDTPTPPVGGMKLNDIIYSNADIRAGLHLAPNAVVMIYSCFSSGSSDTDKAAITQAEARRRVDEYSAPYLDLGASVVLANWYPEAFQMYIRYLFQGMTFGQAFKTFYDYDPAMANLGVHPSRPGIDLWLEYENWNPYPIPAPQYDSSLVGKSGATLEKIFAPAMELSAQNINLLVKPNTGTQTFHIVVDSSWDHTFTWTAGDNAAWVNTTPSNGVSGSAVTVQVIPGSATGVYQAQVTVNTTDPLIVNKTAQVHINLIVSNTIHKTFIPFITR
jgi:hypothetical protein